MILGKFARVALGALVAALLLVPNGLQAEEAGKTIKIGVVYDLTGPFAGGGSELQYLGAKIMIDWFNEHGGIDGYKVEPGPNGEEVVLRRTLAQKFWRPGDRFDQHEEEIRLKDELFWIYR